MTHPIYKTLFILFFPVLFVQCCIMAVWYGRTPWSVVRGIWRGFDEA